MTMGDNFSENEAALSADLFTHARAATTVSEGYKIEMPRILTLEAVLHM